MRCQKWDCTGHGMVYDTRTDAESGTVWRRRKCDVCAKRWTTAETATTKPMLWKRNCDEPGCDLVPPLGKRICLKHRAAHNNTWQKGLRDDLKHKVRTCRNHPDKNATIKTSMRLCEECLSVYRAKRRETHNESQRINRRPAAAGINLSETAKREILRDLQPSERGPVLPNF
jgi:hypothetical protein